jgi:rhodanese-related sulfurtransferase
MTKTAMDLVAEARLRISEIDQSAAQALLDHTLIVDVREPAEYAEGCLPGAVNIPRGLLEFRIDSHPGCDARKDAEIILYCQSGARSALAADALQNMGYRKPMSLAGGFKAWHETGLPVEVPKSG